MRKFNLLLQEFLKITLIFLLCFVWLRYFLRKLWLAILISVVLTLLFYLVLLYFSHKKKSVQGLKIKEKEEAENIFLSLATGIDSMDFFVTLASSHYDKVTKHKEYIAMQNSDKKEKTVLFAHLSFQGLDTGKFVDIYNKIKKEKAEKIIILCHSVVDKQLNLFLKNFNENILIFDQYETYQKLYKFYDCFPKITKKYVGESKLTFKDFLSFSFNKKRAKGYLFSAFVLIFSGLFVRTTIYYCIIASLLIIFAILSQFNMFKSLTKEGEIL
ncbi:MAG: hypothetical protein ACI4R8_00920 [Candidatus Caccovivens sp.]